MLLDALVAIGLAALVMAVAVASFVGFVRAVTWTLRWSRRRDPLRIALSPHGSEDRVVVTVTNRGDEDLELAWGAIRMSDGTEARLDSLLQAGWQILGAKVRPLATSDGYVFPILREWIPAGVTPIGLRLADTSMHERYDKVPPFLGAALSHDE